MVQLSPLKLNPLHGLISRNQLKQTILKVPAKIILYPMKEVC